MDCYDQKRGPRGRAAPAGAICRRALAAVLLAAAIAPVSASAGSPAPADLGVAASLDYCATGSEGIVCKIDFAHTDVGGAERYTASVSGPGGEGVGGGETTGGLGSVWVPYVGSGVYVVSVSAYGPQPDSADRPAPLLDKAEAGLGGAPGEGDSQDEQGSQAPQDEAAEDEPPAPADPGDGAPPTVPHTPTDPAPEPEPEQPPTEPTPEPAPAAPEPPAEPCAPGAASGEAATPAGTECPDP